VASRKKTGAASRTRNLALYSALTVRSAEPRLKAEKPAENSLDDLGLSSWREPLAVATDT
jgi:hypothetical protein